LSDWRGEGRAARLRVAGAELVAEPEGGLYWPGGQVLAIADLHLEKGASFAGRGVMLPPYDTPDTLSLVERLVRRRRPRTVIALGDSFHRDDSHAHLPAETAERIQALSACVRWIWIAGNHDPQMPGGLGGEAAEEVAIGPFIFRHAPREGAEAGEISGHLHPVARLRARGRVIRARCFVASAWRVVMPALGAYAGGLNVLDPAFSGLFPSGRFHAWMLGGARVHALLPSRLVADPGRSPAPRAGVA